jgi:hypothetical protein
MILVHIWILEHFEKLDYFFCSFIVIIIDFDNVNDNMLSIELRIKRIEKKLMF